MPLAHSLVLLAISSSIVKGFDCCCGSRRSGVNSSVDSKKVGQIRHVLGMISSTAPASFLWINLTRTRVESPLVFQWQLAIQRVLSKEVRKTAPSMKLANNK